MQDVVGLPIGEAAALLAADGLRCTAERARPTRDYFPVDENEQYVIRQKIREDGSILLTVAAKLRKEVC